ncbi:MAG TPA: MlaD family protein [Sandaracinaceae bacterium LLY-WYZ-13_1]|nr:MlaD family protein [Sandaracinaceae bacterium LLY-WYZ-13_1]
MGDRVKAAKVGTLVVAALVAAFVVWRLVDERAGTDDGYRVCAVFDNAHGLITKSRVTVAGIPVGYIESIELQGARARVDMTIENQVELYENARIERRSASLLGEYILAINPGDPSAPRLEGGECIQETVETPDTADIMADVGAVASSVRSVAEQVERVFGTDEGGRQMADALRNLTEALEAVNRTVQANEAAVTHTLQNIDSITTNAEPELARILDNVATVTRDLRDIIEHNRDGLDEGVGEVGPTIASINRASQQLERVLEDVGEITERTAAGEGTVGRLTSDEHLIDEAEEVVEGINNIVGGFSRLQTIVGLRSEYLFLSNAFKNYLEVRIAPSEDRYFLIQLVDDPRGQTQFTTTQVRTSPPRRDEPAFYEEVRATTTESLLFSLQLAKRLYFMTFRFGILESSGGIGLDLHLFDDRFEMNADLFRFGDQTFPNLRVRIAYEIVETLYILGGVDNILNADPSVPAQNGADFFLGAQLRFDDQDLISLFPFLGGVAGAAN